MSLLPSITDPAHKFKRAGKALSGGPNRLVTRNNLPVRKERTCRCLVFILLGCLLIHQESYARGLNTWNIRYENALYNYLTNSFFKSAAQFNKLVNTQKKELAAKALHFSILSLSALNQRLPVLQKLKIYRQITLPETLFDSAEKFHKWGDYHTSNEILKAAIRVELSQEQSDRYHYLSAKTLIHLERGRRQPMELLNRVSEGSHLYYAAQSLGARLLFRDREFESAAAKLAELIKKIGKKESSGITTLEHREEALLLLGKIYFESKQFVKAEAQFNKIRANSLRYESLSGLHWVYFTTGQFKKAAKTLLTLKTDFPERFEREALLFNLAFSALYAREYEQAVDHFKELTLQMEAKKRVMEKILSEEREDAPLSLAVIKTFFNSFESIRGNGPGRTENFEENRELLESFRKKLILARMKEDSEWILRKSRDLETTYKMRFGPVDTFIANFDKRVTRLDSLYTKFKKEVAMLDFRVGGTMHNKNYFKEWFESNLNKFAEGKTENLTDFEKNIVQMFTHEIMYRQRVDSGFITKIVANRNSLENLHTLSQTEWPQKIDKIVSENELGLKEVNQINIIHRKLAEMGEKIKALKKELLRKSIALVRKEAFRVLSEQELVYGDVRRAYEKSKESLALQTPGGAH